LFYFKRREARRFTEATYAKNQKLLAVNKFGFDVLTGRCFYGRM